MKIERPDFYSSCHSMHDEDLTEWLNQWFDQHVEPVNKMLDAGVEVYQRPRINKQPHKCCWTADRLKQDTDIDGHVHIIPPCGNKPHHQNKDCWCCPIMTDDFTDEGGSKVFLHTGSV